MKKIALSLVAIVIIGLAWWLGSPLIFDKKVNEEMPLNIESSKNNSEETKSEPQLVLKGTFKNGDDFHKGSGDALVYKLVDDKLVLRLENFQVTNGPDLFVYLSENPSPANSEELHYGQNLNLGELKGNIGNQNYEIPISTDIEKIKSIVIYCRSFGVVFATADTTIPNTLSPSSSNL